MPSTSPIPCVEHLLESAIVGVHDVRGRTGIAQGLARVFERVLIAVEPMTREAPASMSARVSAQPHSAIHEDSTPRWRKMLEHLSDHDGFMRYHSRAGEAHALRHS